MSFQAYLDTIEDKTGLTPRKFVALATERGFDQASTPGPIIEWLAADYGLGRGHAMALVYVINTGRRSTPSTSAQRGPIATHRTSSGWTARAVDRSSSRATCPSGVVCTGTVPSW